MNPYGKLCLQGVEQVRAAGETHVRLVMPVGSGITVVTVACFRSYLKQHPAAKVLYLVSRWEMRQNMNYVGASDKLGDQWTIGQFPECRSRLETTTCVVATFLALPTLLATVGPEHFDYIVITGSYRSLEGPWPALRNFTPKFLLDVTTQTPEQQRHLDFNGPVIEVLPDSVSQPHNLPATWAGAVNIPVTPKWLGS